ncbi:MAG: MFS transporter [Candidatus Heimdallarchaeota archaeon]|nr:MFS transporter [Candidatus Heimdallarchaeota archaeon]
MFNYILDYNVYRKNIIKNQKPTISMDQKGFPYWRTALASFGYFTNNLTWSVYNLYVPSFLATQFSEIFGEDAKIIYTLVAIVMILDNIASIIIQPAIGHMSDQTWIPKLGRRMPFVIIGIPLAAFFFGMIGSFKTTLWILIVAISGFNISMAFYKSPVMSLIPDTLPREYRSQGSGVLNVVGGVASITGLIVVTSLIDTPFSFWSCSIIMIICLIILVFSVKEKKDADIEKSDERINLFRAIRNTFREGNKTLIIMLFSIFAHTAGYTVVETFIKPFTENVLHFPEKTSGYILAVFVGISILLAIPAGLIGQKVGALNACLMGLTGFIISMVPLAIVSLTAPGILANILTLNLYPVASFKFTTIIYGLLVGLLAFSWLVLSINSIVVIWNMAPKRKTATYTSYFYIFIHLAAVISPLIAGGLFDIFRNVAKRLGFIDKSGLEIMFLYVTICFIIALALAVTVKAIRTKNLREMHDTKEYVIKRFEDKEYPLMYLPMLLFGFGLRQERALSELRKAQFRERKEHRKKIRLLKKEIRKLKFSDITDDSLDDLMTRLNEIREYKEFGKELKKEHKEQRKGLREDIIKEKITKKIIDETSKSKKEKNNKDL